MSKPQVERQKIFVLLDNHPDVQFLAHGAAADVWKYVRHMCGISRPLITLLYR